MQISPSITNVTWPGGPSHLARALADVAVAADAGGLDTLWVNDHLLQNDPGAGPDDHDMVEAYTTLGYLAAITQTVRLGAMVSPVTYREPAVLIKAVTTLDVLSGGRAWLGIGVGYPGEAEAMGLPLPPTAERFERLRETLTLMAGLQRGDTGPFEGRHYRLAAPENVPAPLQPDGVPVLIGGTGEQKTLRLVAEYGSACNLFDIPDGGKTLRHKLEVLRRHCDEVGRDYDTVAKTVSTRLSPGESAAEFAERCTVLHGHGLEHAVVITPGAWTPATIGMLADAASLVHDL